MTSPSEIPCDGLLSNVIGPDDLVPDVSSDCVVCEIDLVCCVDSSPEVELWSAVVYVATLTHPHIVK